VDGVFARNAVGTLTFHPTRRLTSLDVEKRILCHLGYRWRSLRRVPSVAIRASGTQCQLCDPQLQDGVRRTDTCSTSAGASTRWTTWMRWWRRRCRRRKRAA